MSRANNFDALRLLAAASVLFSHSFLIAQGSENHEPLIVLSGRQSILGLAGVFVFFAISGFLVTQSFEQTGSPWRYLAKRALRIFPGLFVALALAAFVLAPLVTTLPLHAYFSRPAPYRYVFWNMLFDLRQHELPGTMFVNNPVGLEVNGSLWTLGYEFQMYLMVMALGMLGLLRLPVLLALWGLGIWCIASPIAALGGFGWLLSFFASGMVLYKLKDTRLFDGRLALLALIGLAATVRFGGFILLFSVFGSYLALWLALTPRVTPLRAARFGDLSYGLYIYGWPAEQAVIWAMGGHAAWWQVWGLATPLAAALAFLSWHWVEAPALRLKPRGRAALAAPQIAPAE